MNNNILIVLILILCTNVFAQRPAKNVNERQIEKMKAGLSLSEVQYVRLKEANQMIIKEQDRVRADTSMTREKLMSKRKSMLEAWNDSIRKILSKEQYDRWMAMKPGEARRSRPSVSKGEDMEKLRTEVGLSEEQLKKIKDINAIMTTAFQKLRADTTTTGASRRAAAKTILDERNKNVKETLTPGQYEIFVAFEKERAQSRERRPVPR